MLTGVSKFRTSVRTLKDSSKHAHLIDRLKQPCRAAAAHETTTHETVSHEAALQYAALHETYLHETFTHEAEYNGAVNRKASRINVMW